MEDSFGRKWDTLWMTLCGEKVIWGKTIFKGGDLTLETPWNSTIRLVSLQQFSVPLLAPIPQDSTLDKKKNSIHSVLH